MKAEAIFRRALIAISDNVRPRCGHRGTFPVTYLFLDGNDYPVPMLECPRCKSTWIWGEQ